LIQLSRPLQMHTAFIYKNAEHNDLKTQNTNNITQYTLKQKDCATRWVSNQAANHTYVQNKDDSDARSRRLEPQHRNSVRPSCIIVEEKAYRGLLPNEGLPNT